MQPAFISKIYLLLLAIGLFLAPRPAFAQSITIQGRVATAAGVSINGGAVLFRVQIVTPDANLCVLYDETQTLDLSQTNGLFSININNGSGLRNAPTTYTLEQAISNRMSLSVDASYCPGSSASGPVLFSPAFDTNRKVNIAFRDPSTMAAYEAIPTMDLNPLPYAMEATRLGGYSSNSFLRVVDSGVPGSPASFSSAQFTELQNLIGGTSNNYMSTTSGATTGARLPTVSGNPSSPSAGSIWFDTSGSGALKYYDSSGTIRTVGTGSGSSTISQITAGTGLLGGGSTGNITLSLSSSGVTAGTYGGASSVPQLTVDAFGRITSVTSIATGAIPATGNSGEFLRYDGTNWVSTAIGIADLKNGAGLPLYYSNNCASNETLYLDSGTNQFKCKAITGLPVSALPDSTGVVAGTTYQSVTVDAKGRVTAGSNPTTLSGYNISDGVKNSAGVPSISAGNDLAYPAHTAGQIFVATDTHKIYRDTGSAWELIGSATGSGGTITNVVAGTGLTGGGNSGAVTLTLSDVGTAGSYAKVTTDAQGRVTSGSALAVADLPSIPWSKLTATPTTISTYGITDAVQALGTAKAIRADAAANRGAAGNSGRVFIASDTGAMYYDDGTNWIPISSGSTATLGGDVTGAPGTNTVATVGGSTAVNVHNAELKANAATDANTASSIVMRDASKGFSANAINASSLLFRDSGSNTATLSAPTSLTASYSLKLPASAGASGNLLSVDASGNLTWASPTAATSVAFTAPMVNAGTASAPNVSIPKSTASVDGYLAGADFDTFNKKLSSALASMNIFVGNGSGVATAVPVSGDLSVTNAGAFTVGKIKGTSVSAVPTTAGQMLRYDGTNYTPGFVGMADLRSKTTGVPALGTSCTASQTLTWDSVGDTLSCQNIGIDGSQISSGTINAARLPASASLWQAGASNAAYYNAGNVGIGTTSPAFKLDVAAGASDGIRLQDNSANYKAWLLNDSNAGELRLYSGSSILTALISGGGNSGITYFNAGSVGIGTSAPVGTLEVSANGGSGANIVTISNQSTLSNTTKFIGLAMNGTDTVGTAKNVAFIRGIPFDGNYVNSGLSFWTRNADSTTEKMRIDNAGNMGIGTTAPNTTLDINGAFSVRGMAAPALSPVGQGRIYFDSSSNQFMVSQHGGAYSALATTGGTGSQTFSGPVTMNGSGTGLTVTNNASVGGNLTITGTTTHTGATSITNSTASTSTSTGALTVAGGMGVAGTVNANILAAANGTAALPSHTFTSDLTTGMWAPGSNSLALSTNGTEKMRILSSGFVGVNTTAPAYTIHAVTNGSAITAERNDASVNPARFWMQHSRSGAALTAGDQIGELAFSGYSSTGYAGNLTSSEARIWAQLDASAGVTSTSMPTSLFFDTKADGSANSTTRMTILSGGNVGINSTAPSGKLDVNGIVALTGSDSITANPPSVGTALGWKLGLWSNSFAIGLANSTIALKSGTWVSLFSGNPANNATTTVPDSNAQISLNASNGNALFNGNIGAGTTAPTARLHIKAGTAAANTAPLKFTSGVLQTTPEAGAVEFDGTNLYYVDSGGARRTIASAAASGAQTLTGPVTISGTGTALTVTNNASVGGTLSVGGATSITNSTASTSTSTGALTVAGGLGVAGTVNANIFAAANGAAGTPSHTFTSDLTTGSWLPTAGSIAWSTSGAERMRLNSTGFLGVGTGSPRSKLHVEMLDAQFTIHNSNQNGFGSFVQDTYNAFQLGMWNSSASVVSSLPANTQKTMFAMDYSGKVGSTTNSATNGSASGVVFRNLLDDGNGNVGIGSTSPAGPLDVLNSSSTNGSTTAYFTQPNLASGGNQTFLKFGANTAANYNAADIAFYYGASGSSANQLRLGFHGIGTKMVLQGDGSVGIGTTAPSYALDVNTNATNAGRFQSSSSETMLELVNTSTSGHDWRISSGGSGGGFAGGKFGIYDNTAGQVRLTIDPNGGVGIGTLAPAQRLSVADSLSITNTSGSQYLLMGNQDSVGANHPAIIKSQNGAIEFGSGTSWAGGGGTFSLKMVMGDNGYVGIGTASPDSPLHVLNGAHFNAVGAGLTPAGFSGYSYGYETVSTMSAGANLRLASSGGVGIHTAGNINPSFWVSGNSVGIGTINPGYRLDVQGGGVNASGGFTQTSDIRLKTNIEYLDSQDALKKITSLRGIYYDWKDPEKQGHDHQIGLIAQDVEKVFPEAVKSNSEGFLSLSYPNLVAPVIESIKELFHLSQDQSREIASLKAKNADLERRLKQQELEMKARLEKLEKALRSH